MADWDCECTRYDLCEYCAEKYKYFHASVPDPKTNPSAFLGDEMFDERGKREAALLLEKIRLEKKLRRIRNHLVKLKELCDV